MDGRAALLPVRRAGPEDAVAIAELDAAAFPQPWPATEMAAWLDSRHAVGYVIDRPEVAAAGLLASALYLPAVDEVELIRLAVAESARRSGLASRLVEASLADLAHHGLAVCHLEVRAGNEPAIALYRRLGFESIGVRRGYYSDGEDACLYRRRIAVDS